MLLEGLDPKVGEDLAAEILEAEQRTQDQLAAQRTRVTELEARLARMDGQFDDDARDLLDLADELVRKSVWIVGGDGWAYDIGSGGLDHVLASGRDVNILVLDTEVYSNTGGQASKATPRAAVAKFASQGKATGKKDLGMMAMAYGNVYVAQVAIGGNDMQTVKAFAEAEAWPGPSLIIAYSTCIAHGIEMSTSMTHQKDAVKAGYWPLYRYNPQGAGGDGTGHPFHLDSKKATLRVRDFTKDEARFGILARTAPAEFERLMERAQEDVDERWKLYEQLAGVARVAPHLPEAPGQMGPVAADEEG